MFARGQGRVFGYTVDTPKQLAESTTWCDSHGFNSYWQINPTRRRGGTKCSAEDITHWCLIPFDIDPIDTFSYSPEMALVTYELAFRKLIEVDIDKSTWIDSGRGIQGLYAIKPLELTAHTRYGASQFMSRLFHTLFRDIGETLGCVLDTSCSDLPRVMRMPYTINQKTGRRTHFVGKPSQDFSLTKIPDLPEPTEDTPVIENAGGWIDFMPYLTVAARCFIQGGHPEPGRHKAAAAGMLSLKEKGATYSQTISALRVGAALCEPPLPFKEILTMVNRKFAKPLTLDPTLV